MIRLLRRLRYMFRQRELDSDLAEEIEFHRQMKQKDFEESGASESEAHSASRRALGNTTMAREEARAVWIWPALDQLVRDARIGARMLLKSPLFTIFAALILSIGIGANVTVFTYLNAIFLRPLDVPDPSRMVKIYGDGEGPNGVISYQAYERYRDANQSFASIGMYFPEPTTPLRLDGPRMLPIDIVRPVVISASLFSSVGLEPAIGRNIEADDERLGAANVVMLNYAAWEKYFGADLKTAGRTLYLNNSPHRIIGVLPKSFERIFEILPSSSSTPAVLIPARTPEKWSTAHSNLLTTVIGRLKRGVSITEAQADLSRLASQLSIEKKFHLSVSVEPSNEPPSWLWVGLASLIAFFMVGVFVVLMIACDDIAILLAARIAARQREIGVRLALGANRAQLVRQFLAEHLILAGLGGMGATMFALMTARVLEFFPIPSARLTLDWQVLLFTTVLSLGATLLFGMRPALQYAWKDVVVSLNPGSREASTHYSRIRSNLVITQVTVCTALLITAGVLVRSTRANLAEDRGFVADHVLAGTINFAGSGYDQEGQRDFFEKLLRRLNETPGIVASCVVNSLPVALPGGDYFRFGGALGRYVVRGEAGAEDLQVSTNIVSPGHFETLRIRLIQGRDFSATDRMNSPKVGIVNEAMAQLLWGKGNAVGRNLRGEDGDLIEVIGVAGNLRYQADERIAPLLYRPLGQTRRFLPNTVLIRTAAEPLLAGPLVQAKVGEIDPNLLVFNLHSLEERISRVLLPFRVFAYVAGIPGTFALLLGIIGTYGTMALVVAQRRREIGIRIALGAHPLEAVKLITRQGMKWTAAGLGLGILGGALIVMWLSRNFYGLNFYDPVAFAAMTAAVAMTAGAAFYIPARRASRLDPIKVLRED